MMNDDMSDYPHVPAAFINVIADEGTKAEAVKFLQEQWNETCALRSKISDTADFLDRLAGRIDVLNMRTRIEAAADCRAKAQELRGEIMLKPLEAENERLRAELRTLALKLRVET